MYDRKDIFDESEEVESAVWKKGEVVGQCDDDTWMGRL